MKLRYIGPFADGVYIPDVDAECMPGETIDVPEHLAERMLEQTTNWQAVAPAKSKTTIISEPEG